MAKAEGTEELQEGLGASTFSFEMVSYSFEQIVMYHIFCIYVYILIRRSVYTDRHGCYSFYCPPFVRVHFVDNCCFIVLVIF